MANIEVAWRGHRRESHVKMGLPLFLKKVHQCRFGLDASEFLAKNAMEQVFMRGPCDPQSFIISCFGRVYPIADFKRRLGHQTV